eukprot:795392-Alexandrium_andersonii.AAC.1
MKVSPMPMCTWTETASRGIEAKVAQLLDGEFVPVPAVGLDKAVDEPAFAMPVIRDGSVARLAGSATRAEAGARARAAPDRAEQAVREYLDPTE